MNVSEMIRRYVEENPEKTAIMAGDRRISYGQLDVMINRAASGFLGMGLKKGEVLSLFLPSLPELVIGYLGGVRAGIVVNVVNAMLKEEEVVYILRDCSSRAVIADSDRLSILQSIRGELSHLSYVIPLKDEETEEGGISFEMMLRDGDGALKREETRDEDLCHLMYTSGTTGWPKGVMATHRNVYHNAVSFGEIHFSPEDVLMVATPIFHCWGLISGTFGMLSRGGTVIIVERFYPDKALDEIERLRPTIFQGVPPMYNVLLKQPDLKDRDISSVKFCLSAATKMPESLILQVEKELGWRYAEAWGLTEISCVGATAPYQETRIGSCGRGMADAELKVVDGEGREQPVGEQGELCVRGTCVTNGYLNKPEATQAVFDADGWFHSGDIAYLDEEGFAYIVDRKKDMINVGGEKVFPSEVEDMMLSHPKIKDVVIVGVSHEIKGEAPMAFIQLKEGTVCTEDEIRAYCKAKMAPYKVPVRVKFLDEIPRSAAGKALRRLLKEQEENEA